MKPADLHPILATAAVALFHAGVMLSVFVGLHRLGAVVAACGLLAAGGWALARYLAWEAHE